MCHGFANGPQKSRKIHILNLKMLQLLGPLRLLTTTGQCIYQTNPKQYYTSLFLLKKMNFQNDQIVFALRNIDLFLQYNDVDLHKRNLNFLKESQAQGLCFGKIS